MNKKTRLYNLLIITALSLGACNLRFNNVNDLAGTAAAQTVQALLVSATPLQVLDNQPSSTPLSLVPASLTPIPLPIPTNTPLATATSNCNIAQFITDVTYPDNTVVTPGTTFLKTWRIKNVGTCTWTPSYAVIFSTGNAMNGPSTQALAGNVNPGQTLDISVNLTAPSTVGDYRGDWKLRDASGVLFGGFYVQIKAQNPAVATNTLPPAIFFAVTSVTFSVTGACPNFSYTYNITTNGAGIVNSHRVFSSGTDTLPRTFTFLSAGTQSVTEPVYVGAGTSKWTDIYIDEPNHQQFGRVDFTCP